MNQYKIKTLRDIYNLPTINDVENCLLELSQCIIHARKLNDLTYKKLVENKNPIAELSKGFPLVWPEETIWTDDDNQKLSVDIIFDDGKIINNVIKD